MNVANTLYACYRRPDPATGHLYRAGPKPGQPESPIGKIEYTQDPAFFFHAEKFRGTNELARIAIMEAISFGAVQQLLASNPLTEQQQARWAQVRDRVLICSMWFTATQHTGRALYFSPDRYDGLDVQKSAHAIQDRLANRVNVIRLLIAGSREMKARLAGYALIEWFVRNRDLGALGHGVGGIVDEVVSGNANGSDSIGEEWAMQHYIPVAHFPAAWELGNHAGFLRNEEMGKVGTHLLAFHFANSKGTANMIDIFVRAKKPFWKFTDTDVTKMQRKLAEGHAPEVPDDSTFSPRI